MDAPPRPPVKPNQSNNPPQSNKKSPLKSSQSNCEHHRGCVFRSTESPTTTTSPTARPRPRPPPVSAKCYHMGLARVPVLRAYGVPIIRYHPSQIPSQISAPPVKSNPAVPTHFRQVFHFYTPAYSSLFDCATYSHLLIAYLLVACIVWCHQSAAGNMGPLFLPAGSSMALYPPR